MSWMEKAKGLLNKGVQDVGEGLKNSLEEAKVNAETKAEERKAQKTEEKNRRKSFKVTAKTEHVEMDKNNQLWRLTQKKVEVFSFDELISYELIQDGDTLTSGGLGVGRAMVGTVLAGPIGAVLGGLTKGKKTSAVTNNLQIRITNSASAKPTIFITLIEKETKHTSKEYKKAIEAAQETLGLLDIIANGK